MTTGVRTFSYGQGRKTTLVDWFGVWLSKRQVSRWAPSFQGLDILDAGCGYEAKLARTILPEARSMTLLDVSLAPDLVGPNLRAVQGTLPDSLEKVESESADLILCLSVLEHLWKPEIALKHFQRILRPGGTCLLNVPTWRGKTFLEFSAFRLGLSAPEEMDDHKTYYDPKDLWPLLVQAGFLPSRIKCFRHKFGLNAFAVCRKAAHSG